MNLCGLCCRNNLESVDINRLLNFMKKYILAASLSLSSCFACAATTAAWEQLFLAAKDSCARASGFKNARPDRKMVDFSSKVMVVIRGNYAQPYMKNAPGTLFCLYDKKSGSVEFQEPILTRG
jgi:hypothetical protein